MLTRSTGSQDLAPPVSFVQGRYIRGEELEVVGYDWWNTMNNTNEHVRYVIDDANEMRDNSNPCVTAFPT